MEYMTAASYKDYERIGTPYVKDGKMYTKVKGLCPRCNGLGLIISRVENGQLIPIPVDGGVCYQCLGQKYIYKDVRLYTEKEFTQMEAANERARVKREAERREKMEAEFNQKKAQWLEKNGFNKEGKTFIITGESYSIKDELKSEGYIYHPILKWHKAVKEGNFIDRVIEINVNDYFTFSAWGEGWFIQEKKEKLDKMIANKPENLFVNSDWLNMNIGERFSKLSVTFISLRTFFGRYGQNQIVTFQETGTSNLIKWFTSVNIPYNEGDHLLLSGTIKEKINDKYEDNAKVTIVTRCKMLQGSN